MLFLRSVIQPVFALLRKIIVRSNLVVIFTYSAVKEVGVRVKGMDFAPILRLDINSPAWEQLSGNSTLYQRWPDAENRI